MEIVRFSALPQVITLAHGGGRQMHQLLEQLILPVFANPCLETRHDSAVVELSTVRLALTTDSYVVRPLEFPGGDIGSLAVYGTVNDLAMCGARPFYLSCGLILEEGLPLATLRRLLQSMQEAAQQANVLLVTGDTKVVERGKGDGLYINTAGVGLISHPWAIAPASVRPGDMVLVNGDLGRHGMAVMAVREGLAFETQIESDSAPLADLVLALLEAGIEIHCLRDLTRGGLVSALVEIAETAAVHIHLDENCIPVNPMVRGACEILGLDPLYVACEGRFVALIPPSQADQAISLMRTHALGGQAVVIGQVIESAAGLVTLKTPIGTTRRLDLASGEQLPRIC
ncbi:MAG: hydrogenase expression/formation protein HypE [Deltaproteobacteria bacterium]|nr:hydrogenase expression/formation protein HypE [Deltaproteobacteria bacterium]